MEMSAKEFKFQFYAPIVYCWKRGEQYEYIGHCYYGYRRMLTKHGGFKIEEMEDTDTIEIYHFENRRDCLANERRMIYQYNPRRNGKQGRKPLGGLAEFLDRLNRSE